MARIILLGPVEPVEPGVNDGFLIEVINTGHDAIPEFLFGFNTDVAQHRASELGEEALDEIEPRAMRGCEGELEAADRLLCEPGVGLFRDVRGMIVEDQLDRGVSWVGGIQNLEKFDEFTAAMTVPDERVNLSGEQINTGQQTNSAMAFVFVIACEGRMHAGLGWQVRRRIGDRLNAWLFIIRNDRDGIARLLFGSRRGLLDELDLAINTQNLSHLLLELRVAAFQIIADLVRLDLLLVKDLDQGALSQLGEATMPLWRPMLTRMACEKARRPQFVRVAEFLGLTAGQVFNPSLSFSGDRRCLAGRRPVIEGCHRAFDCGPLHAALGRLMVHPRGTRHCKKRKAFPIGQQYPRPLHPDRRLRARAADLLQRRYFHVVHRQFNRSPPSRHDFYPCCRISGQPYMSWQKTESSRIAGIGSVSGNRCTRLARSS